MNQGLLLGVPGTAPAEAYPAEEQPRETAFAEHLRLLDNAVSSTRARAQRHEKELMSLQAQVGRLRGEFAYLRTCAEELERGPLAPPPGKEPAAEPAPRAVHASKRLLILALAAAACVAVTLRPRFKHRSVKMRPHLPIALETRGADVLVLYGHGRAGLR